MKALKLTQNRIAIVGDAEFDDLSRFEWYAYKNCFSGEWSAARKAVIEDEFKHRVRLADVLIIENI